MADQREVVSVVVPTKDTVRTLERCLRSIREQTWPVELVVIDNFSTDGTWEVAQELAHVAIQAGPERSAQRNLGVEKSSGEWVLWIDADMELPVTILERAMEALAREDGDAVFIPEVTVGDGYWTRCRALERSCCTEEMLVQSPRLLRRRYLLDTGGFLTTLSGTEDAELRTRMIDDGCTMVRIPDLIIHDEGRLSLPFILRKRFYYGRGLVSYRRDHPGALGGQASAAVWAYARNWRKLAAEPSVAVGVVAMRAGELFAYGLGALVGSRDRTGGTR
ncbi:MAG TPA: glycosyltransferase [Acidimicrobiales bacterium]|nr:glycosyltransferase [Acidimicrobiales bacterium]